jgi:hypothetical protein
LTIEIQKSVDKGFHARLASTVSAGNVLIGGGIVLIFFGPGFFSVSLEDALSDSLERFALFIALTAF